MFHKKFDFIVIGSGLAGLYTAYCASKHGRVALLTKSDLDISNSHNAQGGIASVTDKDDDIEYHFEDTIVAGRYLCDHKPLEILVKEGPMRIKEIINLGMKFDTTNGKINLGLEGGHNKRRILHAGGDSTGKEITNFFISLCKKEANIEIFENEYTYKLIVDKDICAGLYSWNTKTKENSAFIANTTIMATGGVSAIYQRTTNPETSTGDGLAIAYNAGAELQDMEFIQFHPSAFYNEQGDSFLISEAVRGEGAYLVNNKNERFMLAIHKLAELAPRDIVAKAIFNEMKSEGKAFVRLKLDHLNPELIKNRFPSIFKKCAEKGVDMTKEIPVAPAAHYMVGGVKTDTCGQTKIKNLYVCGELASTGVMGANRLASNSLLECLVYGQRAINHAKENKETIDSVKIEKHEIYKNPALERTFIRVRNLLSELMNTKVGIIRNALELEFIIKEIVEIKNIFPFEENEYYSNVMSKLIQVTQLISKAALNRKESRGGHYRSDFPEENKDILQHSIQSKNKDIYFTEVNTTSDIVHS